MFIEGENHAEILIQRLERYRSENLCRKMVAKRVGNLANAPKFEPSVYVAKSEGLSFAISNGLSFHKNLKAECGSSELVSAYYSEIWFWMAEILADPSLNYTLPELQLWTEFGHGLKTHMFSTGEFPDNILVYMPSDGFLYRYLKAKGLNVSRAMSKITNDEEAENAIANGSGYRLTELLVRIPELQDIGSELIESPSRVHTVIYDTFGNSKNPSRQGVLGKGLESRFSVLTIYSDVIGENVQTASELKVPLTEMRATPRSGSSSRPGVSGNYFHSTDYWHEQLRPYKSPFTNGFKWIEPLIGLPGEVRVLNFMCLYVWSILARYKPALWQRIQSGDLDHFYPLIVEHLTAFKRISPNLALENVVGEHVTISQPGSFIGSGVSL